MSEHQKAIIEALIRLEYATNKLLRDANEEGMVIDCDYLVGLTTRRIHFTLSDVYELKAVPNDD